MSTAIFGGTFDPIHNGHLAAARAAADGFGIAKVLFIPAGHPPHKHRRPEADYSDRLRMVELACATDSRFVASRLEEPREAAEPHYSVNTIHRLRQDLGPDEILFFILGADAFTEFPLWYRREEVAREVEFLVVSRPGSDASKPQPTEAGVTAHFLKDIAVPISSTQLRSRLRSRGEAEESLPPAVAQYIQDHHLYSTTRS